MPVRLRMQRFGAKKRPYYRIVATDKRNPRDGRYIEQVGTYDPLQDPPAIRMNVDRVKYWVNHGAQPSDTVRSLMRKLKRGEGVDLSQEGADKAALAARLEDRKKAVEAQRARAKAEGEEAAKAAEQAEAKEAAAEEKAEEAAPAEEEGGEEEAAAASDDATQD